MTKSDKKNGENAMTVPPEDKPRKGVGEAPLLIIIIIIIFAQKASLEVVHIFMVYPKNRKEVGYLTIAIVNLSFP